ncbi:MAG: hypothetical protein CL920_24470 [Deltaproteobacteria bacterium]|nr:hypothetical protein [Deltaproteobacteria bacterium]|tara:strand:+ start:17879 stop:19126 length:1248 start_codon:yes stop_codon:yes gene_type:complete
MAAQWVLQSDVTSITPQARNRTEYLQPLRSEVANIVRGYINAHPDGEEVTLEVLERIGKERLKEVAPEKDLMQLKRDLGLLAAQVFVDLVGAMFVESLRRPDGRTASTRRCRREGLDWVHSYTPHRLVQREEFSPRILLDTGIIRKVVHDDADAIDLESLGNLKGEHPVSVADGAFGELANALLKDSIPFEDWKERVRQFDSVLDPDFPVAPGGKELSAMWGAYPMKGLNLAEMRWYYKTVWNYLLDLKEPSELRQEKIVHSPWGRAYRFRLDQQRTEDVLERAGTQWSDWITKIVEVIHELQDDGVKVTEKMLRRMTNVNLVVDMAVADILKLDLVIHIMAKRALQAAVKRSPYKPKQNDAIDLDLLFGIPLPAWVCTSDGRLVKLARSTDSVDADKVMSANELLERLESEQEE